MAGTHRSCKKRRVGLNRFPGGVFVEPPAEAGTPTREIGMRVSGALVGLTLSLVVEALPRPAADPGPVARVDITIVDWSTNQPLPCRIHLKNAAGKPQRAGKLPFFRDHF